MFDPEKVVVWEADRYEGCFRQDGEPSPEDDDFYHSDGPFVKKSAYDQLLELYSERYLENIRLLNDASIWRNRAIDAEEELSGANRLVGLREGFER